MRKTITVYGGGYVGQAVARFLGGHYALQLVDPKFARDPLAQAPTYFPSSDCDGFEPTELAVVCVPTPSRPDGSCDTAIVEQIISERRHAHYLIKSTVPPGTTERLNNGEAGGSVCFSPEYVGEGIYEVPWWQGYMHPTDMAKHTFHIFGGPKCATGVWVDAWSRVAGWVPTYHQTDSRTAELAKYAENMFMAAKKVFCSELYLTARAMGVDYAELRELWLRDVRVGPSMTLVWPEALAYGGKCLPKDTRALVASAAGFGHDARLFRAVVERNDELARLDAASAEAAPALEAVARAMRGAGP